MPTVFTTLRRATLRRGMHDFREFRRNFMPRIPQDNMLLIAGVILMHVFTALAVVMTYMIWGEDSPYIIAGLGVGWFVLTGIFFLSYAWNSSDMGREPLVWLPWQQRWTWGFLLLTLPWLPFWLISLVRLARRPNRIPQRFPEKSWKR